MDQVRVSGGPEGRRAARGKARSVEGEGSEEAWVGKGEQRILFELSDATVW